MGVEQWQIYIEAKDAVLGGHQTQGGPKIFNEKMAVE